MSSVAVVIPCYRQAHFLPEAIESVLAQLHPASQLFVVDDGSPDLPGDVAARYPEVCCLSQENAGLAAARNAGLARSTADYVVFLDADDRLLPNALSAGVAALDRRPDCAFVWGFNRPIDAAGSLLPAEPRIFSGGASYAALLRENVVGPPLGVMFRRDLLQAEGGFSTSVRYAEDYDLYLRLARRHPSWCHQTMIAEYRFHGANMSGNLQGMLEGVLALLDRQEEWVRGNPELERALRTGRQFARLSYDGERRLQELSAHRRAGRWPQAFATGTALLALYPRMFLPLLVGQVSRRVRSLGRPRSA